ncbi:metal ABC transporter ATP-binding protein [Anaerocolumna xylanovorans]|uniref:Manganese/zinc/iron transport system ATP-binding protein n=1 Tax=Anaerocolumna xylanovorans DSM 12503 TaxID=1121345 RepID=A0A1M7XVZ9_9FIRM|nr:metal ABC transporter ATP-binding protein [Anaerocolumna xylanovorans]SHO42885.1 manganese/zinc/iron transport system ATP-binding protein [Anaerocolumna xylanovorans DSM 12503]
MELNKSDYAVQIEDLTVAYDAKPVLWDIDLDIPRGKLMAVIGPNGAGKTTLLKAMLGLLVPVSGTVRFFQETDNSLRKLKNKVAYVPQSGSVDWDFPATVLDIVLMGCYGRLGFIKRPGKIDREAAMQSLRKVGMEDYASRQISQLSGGQQQRVFLARALMQTADIYFMDEPFKGVDVQTEKAIVILLKELKESGKTVVVVHHDLQTVPEYFDWVTLINIKVIASGPVEEVFHEQNLKKAYRSTCNLLKSVV